MSSRPPYHQTGQAIFEALFILFILMTLMFAMQHSGQLRAHSLELLGESSYQSFKKSILKHVHQKHLARDLNKQNGLLQTFTQQLLDVRDDSFINIQSQQSDTPYKRSASNRLFFYFPIQRTSYLHVNAGNSSSGQEAQSRIARSTSAWSDTADQTRRALNAHSVPLAKIDAPWGRGFLTTDWLTGWAGQSPGMKRTGLKP